MKLTLVGTLLFLLLSGPFVATQVQRPQPQERDEGQPLVPFYSSGEVPSSVSTQVVTLERTVEPHGNRTASVGGVWLLRPTENTTVSTRGYLVRRPGDGEGVYRSESFLVNVTEHETLWATADFAYMGMQVGVRTAGYGISFNETRAVDQDFAAGGESSGAFRLVAGKGYVLVRRYSATLPTSGLVQLTTPAHIVTDLQRGEPIVANWDDFDMEGVDASLGVVDVSHVEEATYRFASEYCLTGAVGSLMGAVDGADANPNGPVAVGRANVTLKGPMTNVQETPDSFEFRNAPPGEWTVHYRGDRVGDATVKAWVSLVPHECY